VFGLEKILLFGYLAVLFVVLSRVKIQHHNINEYFIYSRKLSGTNGAFLWTVAWVGGAHTIGLIANASQYGLSAYWYVLGTVSGFLIFAKFLAHRIRSVGDKLNQVTFADIIEDRYDVKTRIIVSVINVVTSILYMASQIVAIGFLLDMSGLMPQKWAVLAGSLVVAIYTGRGGLIYISRLAYLHTGIIVLGSVLVTFYSFQGLDLREVLRTAPNHYGSISQWGWDNIAIVIISIIGSVVSSSDGYLRCLAARGERESRNGLIGAAFLTVVMTVGFLLFGVYSKISFGETFNTGEIMALLWSQLPGVMQGVFMVTLLAVIFSTADISLLTATAGITKDFYNRLIDIKASQKVLLKVNYLATVVAALLSVGVALITNDLFVIIMWAFKITTICLTVPVVGAYCWAPGKASGAFYSIIFSFCAAIFWYCSGLAGTTGINEVWIGLAVSFFVYVFDGLFSSPTEECFRKSQSFCLITSRAGYNFFSKQIEKEKDLYRHYGEGKI